MKTKKNYKVIISIVLSFWLFFMGFELGNYNGEKSAAQSTTAEVVVVTTESTTATQTTTEAQTTQAAETTTAQEVVTDTTETTASSETETTVAAEEETTASTQVSADPSTYTVDEIAANLNEAMAKLEATSEFTAHVIDDIQVTVVDCSIAMATSLVNGVVQMFVGQTDNTYTFADGVETASGRDVADFVVPSGSAFYLDTAGISSASAAQDGDNVVYTVQLVEETATYAEPFVTYHQTTVGCLDLTDIGLPSTVSIDEATLNYHGSTMTVTVDSEGRITEFDIIFPMDGGGTASITVFSGSAEFEGSMDQTWTFTY